MKLTRAVTRETIFHAKSKMQPLGEQMNLPVREAQSATSSLPYGNGYALGKFTSLLLSIYLVSRSTDPFTRFSILFRSPLSLFPSRSTFNPLCNAVVFTLRINLCGKALVFRLTRCYISIRTKHRFAAKCKSNSDRANFDWNFDCKNKKKRYAIMKRVWHK